MAITALVLSALAVGLTTWNLLAGSGSRVSQVERSVGTSLQVLAGRLEATEASVRSAVTEASELFDRAQTERRRTSAAAARMDTAQAEPEGEAIPIDPQERRAHELRIVQQRLSGQGL
jgi:DNA anti-recombination protein RmuC